MTFLFGFAFKFCPVAVIPVQPVSHFAVYAVACIVLVWPPDLDDTFDGDCFVFLSFGFDFVPTETILFLGFFNTSLSTRSEERRVGKDCSCCMVWLHFCIEDR